MKVKLVLMAFIGDACLADALSCTSVHQIIFQYMNSMVVVSFRGFRCYISCEALELVN